MDLKVYVAHIKTIVNGEVVSDLQRVFSSRVLAENWWLEKSIVLVSLGYEDYKIKIGDGALHLKNTSHVRFRIDEEKVW